MAEVVIVSYPGDVHAQHVLRFLQGNRKRQTAILNLGRYPDSDIRLSTRYDRAGSLGVIEINGNRLELSEVRGVWWRRPLGEYRDEPQSMQERYIVSEAGILARSIATFIPDGVSWVSEPEATRLAERKPVQLKVAQEVGLNIPKTLISNDVNQVMEFIEETRGNLIIKAVGSAFVRLNQRRDDSDGLNRVVYTQKVPRAFIRKNAEHIVSCPVILQTEVKKEVDVRVTVVGKNVFAAAIKTTKRGRRTRAVDWRQADLCRHYNQHTLPTEIAGRCVALTRALGLVFGCIDLGFSEDEGYTFFEINPQGQWLPSENVLGYPITESLADLLMG